MEKKTFNYKIKNPISKIQTFWYKYVLARKVAPTPKVSTIKKNSPRNLYAQMCFLRYKQASTIYDEQFLKEISKIEENQPTGWDAMRFRRTFSITMLWPPMHSKKEIRKTFKNYEMLKNSSERKRLEKLLE